MENSELPKNDESPAWLEELQLRSWEPEVLLSGIVLYGMFKTPGLLDAFLNFFQANISASNDFQNLVAILKVGTYWLIFGLILHLVSRGIWVGMVGLSYTFPHGINYQRINFQERFKKKVEKIPPFQKIIINLEKICSALFSMSFMLFMCVLGSYLYIFVMVVLPVLVVVYFEPKLLISIAFQVWIIGVLIIGLFGFLDFVTLGYFKRFKWFAKVYWPIDVVISALTLSRFYRPIYYAFVSNFNRWIIAIAFTFFSVISFFGLDMFSGSGYFGDDLTQITLWHNRTGTSAFSGYYDDQNDEKFSVQAQIQSDIIDGNVLKLFIPAGVEREKSIIEYSNYDSLWKLDEKQDREKFDLQIVKDFYKISLDDSVVSDLPWFYHYKVRTDQRGFLVYIDISALNVGVHTISVGGPPSVSKRDWATIPFYREVRPSSESAKPKSYAENKLDYLQIKPALPK